MTARFGVFGAGAIGCYVGGCLAAAGHEVVLVGRLGDEVGTHGLVLSDLEGGHAELPPGRVPYHAEAAALTGCDVVFVAVKSPATAAAAHQLAAVRAAGTTAVVSLQNGVRNADLLRAGLPGRTVLAGMVPFNVVRRPRAGFHRATGGAIAIERGAGAGAPIAAALAAAGLPVELRDDMPAVLWAKLLLNLNNALNALAGVPLVDELGDPAFRRLLAAAQREALAAMRASGIRPARLGKVLPALVPHVLRLPGPLFRLIARGMLAIDPTARSSMWDDLERRRATEIDFLNGEVVALAERAGTRAPVNRAIVALVRAAELARAGSPRLPASAVRAEVSAAAR